MASWNTTMTPVEMYECRRLLDYLSDEDLASLKDTVVGRRIPVEGRRDIITDCNSRKTRGAPVRYLCGTKKFPQLTQMSSTETIKVIIQLSSSAAELLEHRKILREILFQYLISKSIIVESTAEKSDLINIVLGLWISLQPVDSNPKSDSSNTCLAAPASQRSTSERATASNQPLQQTPEKSSFYTKIETVLKPSSSHTSLAQRSASGTTTTFNRCLATPTSQRSASRSTTVSNQPLQDTFPRRPFYEDTKNDRIAKSVQTIVSNTTCLVTSEGPASETASVSKQKSQETRNQGIKEDQKIVSATTSNKNRATSPKWPSTSGTSTVSSQPLQATLSNRDSQATASNGNRSAPPERPSTSGTSAVSSQLLQAILSNRGSQATTSNNMWAAPASWPSASQTSTVSSQPLQATLSKESSQNQVFGESFVRWFYRLLNAENPAIHPAFERDTFGPQHFWENCSMRIIRKISNRSDQTFTGRVSVSNRLKALARDEHLLFHPNVSMEGVRTIKSPYGPFMLMVCGTIHHNNVCLGIYHQVFSLVGNPIQDNNWKIQVTQLLMENLDDVNVIPRLSISADQDMLAVASAHAENAKLS